MTTKQQQKRKEQRDWERALERANPNVAFYLEVRHGVEFVVAYDSRDPKKHYGEFKVA